MLRELRKADWQAILQLPDELIPHALLLRGTRNLKRQFELHRPLFDDVIEVGLPNGVIEDVFIGRLAGRAAASTCCSMSPRRSIAGSWATSARSRRPSR